MITIHKFKNVDNAQLFLSEVVQLVHEFVCKNQRKRAKAANKQKRTRGGIVGYPLGTNGKAS